MRLIVEPERTAIERAQQLLNQARQGPITGLSQQAIIELIETIIIYKFPKLSRQEIEQMLNLSDLKQTKVYQEALAEGLEQGLEQGRTQGLEQGRTQGLEQGKRQAALSLITRLLTQKVGNLPAAVRSRLEAASTTQLESFAEALLEFSTVQDVLTWFQTHPID